MTVDPRIDPMLTLTCSAVILNSGLSDVFLNLTSLVERRLRQAFELAYRREFNLTEEQIFSSNFTIRVSFLN